MFDKDIKWIIDEKTIKGISEGDGIEVPGISLLPPVRDIIRERGILTEKDMNEFLFPSYDPLDGFTMLGDGPEFIRLVRDHVDRGERITIYGDYDVDGITSIAIFHKVFDAIGHPVDYYIPHRIDEGYGLNSEALSTIRERGTSLVITVDCGVSSRNEADHARAIGLGLIITDHHQCPDVLPDALAVINVNKEGCPYPYKGLAGAGTAYKLGYALLREMGVDDGHAAYGEIAALAALGTIADVAPLTGENRKLVKLGLESINGGAILGITALFQAMNRRTAGITARDMAFSIGPKINACGRIKRGDMGVEILITRDKSKALEIAQELCRLNDERREMEREVLDRCIRTIEDGGLNKGRIIAVYGHDFHSGVIGIVSSRLVERYGKPALVMSYDRSEGIVKSSARSVPGIDIFKVLSNFSHLFLKFGGHEGAAGLSMSADNLGEFLRAIDEWSMINIPLKSIVPRISHRGEIESRFVSFDLIDQLDLLEPFGASNEKPSFSIRKARVERRQILGRDSNVMKLQVSKDDRVFEVISFRNFSKYGAISHGELVDILFSVERNTFNGMTSIQLNLIDLKRYVLDREEEESLEVIRAISAYESAMSGTVGNPVEFHMECAPGDFGSVVSRMGSGKALVLADSPQDVLGVMNEWGGSLWDTAAVTLLDDMMDPEFPSSIVLYPVMPRIDAAKYDIVVKLASTGGPRAFQLPTRDELARVYKCLRSSSKGTKGASMSISEASRQTGLGACLAATSILILGGEKLIDVSIENGTASFSINETPSKIDILSSITYMKLVNHKIR